MYVSIYDEKMGVSASPTFIRFLISFLFFSNKSSEKIKWKMKQIYIFRG